MVGVDESSFVVSSETPCGATRTLRNRNAVRIGISLLMPNA
jgi:hypothetical protein